MDFLSPRDKDGHGTHTASAAGSAVVAASFQGLAAGVVRGGAPRACIAVYKSVWPSAAGWRASTTAIDDGVDVLSLSLVAEENSFGALHAVQKGIAVVYAAGNLGPARQVVSNTAPWVITVAASKIDRSFPTVITLGNKQQIVVRYIGNTSLGKNPAMIHMRALILGTSLLMYLQGQSLYYEEDSSPPRRGFKLLAFGGLYDKKNLSEFWW